jgi:hypothetical protein
MGDKSIPYPLEIITDRLVLRSPELEHAQPLYEAVVESLPELRQWMPWAQDDPAVEKTAENIRKAIDEFKAQTAFRIHAFDRKKWTDRGIVRLPKGGPDSSDAGNRLLDSHVADRTGPLWRGGPGAEPLCD